MRYQLIGNHPSIIKIRELITMVSDMALNVLLLGETGTGKEVVARMLHQISTRRNERFVKINCAAMPLTLLESELFGYEKGAFTGAVKSKPGRFELASEGVMLLDEIGDMPLMLQAKLLNVLQSGEFSRLGGTEDVKVNSWVISATNHDLNEDMKNGLFREDLYYRLNIIKIELPPLRERRQDIPLLVEYFTQRHKQELKIDTNVPINTGLQDLFQDYHWPGNVRELSSTILRLMVGDDPGKIKDEFLRNMEGDGLDVPSAYARKAPALKQKSHDKTDEKQESIPSLKELKKEATQYIERKAIQYALHSAGWNKSQAAKILKISYKALFYKMDMLGIEKQR
ncbi:MAG: sigma-54-dependent Fis family transcriptional regulator [Deltaproteobacteria bacterium]|nr:sigma-54-dependent Fis family transcriptional regulator [Deltaproteobacteria bacterium]